MSDIDYIANALLTTGWNKARARFLSRFLVALIACRSVCLTRLANILPGSPKVQSRYKQLQRFLGQFDLLQNGALARLIVAIAQPKPPFVLALDRTNWKLDKTELNLLVLALVYKGIAFPLFWMALGKAGNSSLTERQTVTGQYLSVFGKDSIAYLCADREFSGIYFAK